MKQLIIGLLLLASLGCGMPTFVKPDGVTDSKFKADSYACVRDAKSTHSTTGTLLHENRMYRLCMESKGYEEAP